MAAEQALAPVNAPPVPADGLAATPRMRAQRRQLKSLFGGAIQLKIQVGNKSHEKDDKALIQALAKAVQGQFSTWADRSSLKDKEVASAVAKLKGSVLEAALAELLANTYDDGRPFSGFDDLRRQAEQDLLLGAIGLPALQGTEQQLDQYLQSGPKAERGEGATRPGFRVYRCMKREHWKAYEASGQVQDILHGHGGSLGQALVYFRKSVADKKLDDVLVEFRFPDKSESELVDPKEIQKGGEGKGPKGSKLGGKSEQNDLFGAVGEIYSINLSASKELVARWKPEVKALAFSQDQNPGKEQTEQAAKGRKPAADAGPLSAIDVMIRLGRMKAGALNIMGYEDWPIYYEFKEQHPELKYSDDE